MPLLRSGSARSTLSTITRRATAYQKYLNLINVFLIITSTVLIFSAIILIKFYHLDKFGFWDPLFEVVPLYMICLGVFTFIVCFFGFAVTATENRGLLVTFAVVLVIVFLAQLPVGIQAGHCTVQLLMKLVSSLTCPHRLWQLFFHTYQCL